MTLSAIRAPVIGRSSQDRTPLDGRPRSDAERAADHAAHRVGRHPGTPAGPVGGPARAVVTARPPESVRDELAGSTGQALPVEERQHHERSLGWDLGAVKIHNGESAARSALARGTRAYASGSHVVFGAQQFRPGSITGRRLLTHELAHVIQQSQAGSVLVQCQPMSVDWVAVAGQLTPAELEVAIRRLRVEISAEIESSEESLQRRDQLAAFERELIERQRPGQRQQSRTDRERGRLRTLAAGSLVGAALAPSQGYESARALFIAGIVIRSAVF